jgi:hypothetical protein
MAIINVRDVRDRLYKFRCLLDHAPHVNFITEATANILGMRRTRNYTLLMRMNNAASDARYSVNILLCSRQSKFQAEIVGLILTKSTGNVPSRYNEHDSWGLPTDLFCADPKFAQPEDVHMLIGEKLFFHLLRPGRYFGEGRAPTHQETNWNEFW